jgi:hypothetical protein
MYTKFVENPNGRRRMTLKIISHNLHPIYNNKQPTHKDVHCNPRRLDNINKIIVVLEAIQQCELVIRKGDFI